MSVENSQLGIVYIVDDDESVRNALSSLLRAVNLQVESFPSAEEFRQRRETDRPACLILDVRLPGTSGLQVQEELVRTNVHIPIIFLTGHADVPMTVRAMKAGAVEFLTKPFRDQELLDAVQEALRQDKSRIGIVQGLKDLRAKHASLTPREREIMAAVVKGLMNKQIAASMGIAEITVKIHRGQVMRKMESASVADLVRMAEALGGPSD